MTENSLTPSVEITELEKQAQSTVNSTVDTQPSESLADQILRQLAERKKAAAQNAPKSVEKFVVPETVVETPVASEVNTFGKKVDEYEIVAQKETVEIVDEIPVAQVEPEIAATIVDEMPVAQVEPEIAEAIVDETPVAELEPVVESVIVDETPTVHVEPVVEISNVETIHVEAEDEHEAGAMFPEELNEVEIPEELQELDDETDDELGDETEEELLKPVAAYAALNKQELIDGFKNLLDSQSIQIIKNDVENIKINFYKKHNAEVAEVKRKFIQGGGVDKDFKIEPDALEIELKELYKKYKDLKIAYIQHQEDKKHDNLKEKLNIIEHIKVLCDGKESLNQTFNEFKELQKRWKEIGPVPQNDVKNLWETYHYHVEKFYDFININKELRDLDLRKNLELKIQLCEKAEELLIEPSVVKGFKTLQKLHNQWREIGPVPREKKDEIWERFKETTSKINKSYQDYFEQLKNEQENNLNEKTMLCEKAEELANLLFTKNKEWEDRSKEIIELQKIWRLIGFAPKKFNNKIYTRFRSACDLFFSKKREFYSQKRDEQNENLQLKTELCIQAEGLKESTDWKKTTEVYIELQKKWKTIGPVPRKQSDTIWTRFRAACNAFFEKKQNHFANIDSIQDENLRQKKALIAEVENFHYSDNNEENLNKLKEFQKSWTEIGHVPFKLKDELQKQFRAAINARFDQLKLDEYKLSELRFKNRMESISSQPKSTGKIKQEREKLIIKLDQTKNDISLWENNIGFFAKSKNAEALISDINNKIDRAKKLAESIQEKIELMDKING